MRDQDTTLSFRVQLACDNDAFAGDPAKEIAFILRELASRLDRGEDFDKYRNLLDRNGNIVGVAKLAPKCDL
jgi:hypothetical protein